MPTLLVIGIRNGRQGIHSTINGDVYSCAAVFSATSCRTISLMVRRTVSSHNGAGNREVDDYKNYSPT